jgi:Domain of unknown function (DUF4340)
MKGALPSFIRGDFAVPSNRALMALSALLLVQLALAAVLKFFETKYQPAEAIRPLLTCDFSKVSKVIVEVREADGKNTSKVTLEKDQSGWRLPDYYSFPASTVQVEQLLKELKDLKSGYPVTTTSGAADRFKVSADKFERAITMFAGDQTTGALYLGTSPSFRAVYAKAPDNDDIYTIELPISQIDAKASDWIDHNALALKPADIAAMDLGSFQLRKKIDNWSLVSPEKTATLHEDVAQNVIDAIAQLSVDSVLGTKESTTHEAGSPVLSCSVTLKNGNVLNYTFSKPKDKNYHVLQTSFKPWILSINDGIVTRIKNFTVSALLKSESEEAAKDKAEQEALKQKPKK